jgi:DNA polymerase-3 subunit delta'
VRAANPVGWDHARDQGPAVAALRQAVGEGRVPHAWLLVGEPGLGQDALAAAFVAALECEATGLAAAAVASSETVLADEGCGTCATCGRVARGSWSGVQRFVPEGSQHLVRAVREEWIPAATSTGFEGRRRVLRVAAADRMNEAVQNAFLKVLEEPPQAVVWLLEVEDPTQLLDTIHSRVRRVDLQPWSPATLRAWAQDELGDALPADAADGLVRAAAGSPDRLRTLTTPARAATRELALTTLLALVDQGPAVVDQLAREVVAQGRAYEKALAEQHAAQADGLHEQYGVERDAELPTGLLRGLKERWKREQRAARGEPLQAYLDDLGSWLRDLVVVVGAGGDPGVVVSGLVNRDRLGDLARDAGRFDLPDLYESLAAVERCRLAFERNGSGEVQLDRLLLTLAGPAFEAARAAR